MSSEYSDSEPIKLSKSSYTILCHKINIKYFAFLTQIRKKYGIFVISTKNKVICDTESIYTSILADEACHFTSFSILRHDDVLTILY